jgi:hypothetical protein
MKNFRTKDLVVSIHVDEDRGYMMAVGCGQTKPDCMAISKCSQTKPDCMAISKCGQTKPDCMAVSNCGQTKPVKHHDSISAYSAQLFNLKQTIAAMQAK